MARWVSMRPADLGLAVLLAVLGGCSGLPQRSLTADAAAPTTSSTLESLPSQRLPPGQCALVLWSKAAGNPRIVMAFSAPPLARVKIGGRIMVLRRTALEGPEVFGHPLRQTFSGDGVTLQVDIEPPEGSSLQGGAVVRAGSVDYRDAAGWSTVTPVGGLIACSEKLGTPIGP